VQRMPTLQSDNRRERQNLPEMREVSMFTKALKTEIDRLDRIEERANRWLNHLWERANDANDPQQDRAGEIAHALEGRADASAEIRTALGRLTRLYLEEVY